MESTNHGCDSVVMEEPKLGRPVYAYDRNANITYWNRSAEKLYGYIVPEAIGQNVVELIGDAQYSPFAAGIIDLVLAGGSWSGEFPVKSKRGEKFVVVTTHTPLYDDTGTLFGIICVSSDLWNCEETRCQKLVIPNLASMMNKDTPEMKRTYDRMDREGGSEDAASSSRVTNNASDSVFGVFYNSNPDEALQFKHHSQSERASLAFDEITPDAKEESMNPYFTQNQCMNIFQFMGESVYIIDCNFRVLFWNKAAEKIYGYTGSEAIGHDLRELIVEPRDYQNATDILDRSHGGETWSGQFPVMSKNGKRITIVGTTSPFYDDNGTLFAVIGIATDSRKFERSRSQPFPTKFEQDLSVIGRLNWINPQEPMQVAIFSKLSDLASKMRNKVKSKLRSRLPESGSQYCHFINNGKSSSILGEIPPSVFGSFTQPNPEVYLPIKRPRDDYHYFASEESEIRLMNIPMGKITSQLDCAVNRHDLGLLSPPSSSNSTSTTSIPANPKLDIIISNNESDCEISWEDLTVGKRIGVGSCGTVYHGMLRGSEVAIKVFSAQDFSNDLIHSFKQEVSFMKIPRHPNILPFMGSVTSSKHLCIVSQFLHRGSLFRLLHRSKLKLDWRRRVHMALDIARGICYLHQCMPPIIHHNLKSSNVLVDKNWSVKVGDFGLSPLKHQAFLTTNTGKGMPQWMAPEVMRTGPSNEK